MNAWEFTYYRLIARGMTREKRIRARRLALEAEAGDRKAAAELLKIFAGAIVFPPSHREPDARE